MKIKYLVFALIIIAVSCKKDDDENVFEGQPVSNPSFAGKKINTIAIDNGGVKWIGASDGLYRFDGTEWHNYPDNPLGTNINHIFIHPASGGNLLYISTDKGAVIANAEGSRLITQAIYTYSAEGILSDSVNAVLIDSRSKEWFGTDSGLCYLQDNNWARSLHRSLPKVQVSSIAYIDTSYFIGTYGNWLYHVKYDEATDAITGASQMYEQFNGSLTTPYAYCVYAGSDNYLWFGSDEGLTRMRGHTKVTFGEFHYYLEGEQVYSVIETGAGEVWAGTGNGVFMQNGDTWINYNTGDGLANNKVNALAEDDDGSIWMGTNSGLSQFDGTNWMSY